MPCDRQCMRLRHCQYSNPNGCRMAIGGNYFCCLSLFMKERNNKALHDANAIIASILRKAKGRNRQTRETFLLYSYKMVTINDDSWVFVLPVPYRRSSSTRNSHTR
mmetsp:Transcript_12673/g.29241  ORF Transcript_12673/g.29241 Transcript_12673/m.29241 type:complete len:106 (-) Transcript_12673:1037-1354(-)